MWSEPGILLPNFQTTGNGTFVIQLAFAPLLRFDEKLRLQPALAESVSISPNGRTYTFKLRSGLKWSDGQPLTAHDVVFTIDVMTHPDYAGNWFNNVLSIAGAQERRAKKEGAEVQARALDDRSVEITLASPNAAFQELFGARTFVLPRHVLAGIPVADLPKQPLAPVPPVGSGPFTVIGHTADQQVELQANANYYLGRPRLDRAIVKVLKPEVAVIQLQRGELDLAAVGTVISGVIGDVPVEEADALSRTPGLVVESYPTLSVQNLVIELRNPLWQDRRVRQALAYALDRKGMVEQLLRGHGTVAIGPIAAISPYYNPNLNAYEYNPDRARELLQQAGWRPGQPVTLTVPTGNRVREQTGVVVEQNLKAVGLNVTIQQFDLATTVRKLLAGELELAIVGNAENVDPDLTRRFATSAITGGVNAGYSNPRVDELLKQGLAETSFEARKKIYDEVQQIINEDVPVIPLYRPDAIGARNRRIIGARYTPNGIIDNIHEWQRS
jgi:peptide/nickel transport system substrate-binding protein